MITTDANLGMPIEAKGNQAKYDNLVKDAGKAQEAARTTVTDASDRIPGWETAKVNLTDPNSSRKGEGPVQGFNKHPGMRVHSPAESAAISTGHVTNSKPVTAELPD